MQMRKVYFVNIITDFLNFWNQLKEPLVQNFVFILSKENVVSKDFGSEI